MTERSEGVVGLTAGLDAFCTGILRHADDELREMASADLERFWFFRWDESAKLEWNIYQFTDLLDLYRRQCRRWEEMHNGSVCVVERVRDKYLLPKIAEFARQLKASNADVTGLAPAQEKTK